MSWDVEPELRALAGLCEQLHRIGIGSEMRDSLPGVAVRAACPGDYLYVFVSTTSEAFVWQTGIAQHPVADAAGAARRIKTFLAESGRL